MTIHGIDVSHHQRARDIDWQELAKRSAFVIARATYGTLRDAEFPEHMKRARDAGLVFGCYAFVRQSSYGETQARVLLDYLDETGYGVGDMLPALDLEENAEFDGTVLPSLYNPRSERLGMAMLARYREIIVYSTQAFYRQLGRPPWWKDSLLWVAHWNAQQPALPDSHSTWTFWQHKVAPMAGVYRGDLDQNLFRGTREELPCIKPPPPPEAGEAEPLPLVMKTPLEIVEDSHRLRDELITGNTPPEDEPPPENAA